MGLQAAGTAERGLLLVLPFLKAITRFQKAGAAHPPGIVGHSEPDLPHPNSSETLLNFDF